MKRNHILASFLIFASTIFTMSQPAEAFLKCKKDDLEIISQAADMYNQTFDLYQKGVIRKSEVTRAQIFVQEARLCAEVVSVKEFCSGTMPYLNELNQEVKMVSPTDRRERLSLFAEGRSLCGF